MRKVRKSIYGEKINELNVTDILFDSLERIREYSPEWYLKLEENWVEKFEEKYKKIDFYHQNIINDYGVYWCGVLTAEPFDCLMEQYTEEDILNLIKNHHLIMSQTDNGLVIQFKNPTSSPLYRFFNKHKEDGFGENIPYSVNGLINKLENILQKELSENLEYYGEWILDEVEDEEEVA